MRFKTFALIGLLLLSNLAGYNQKIIISGEESSRKLTWDDFTGKVDKSSSFLAFTYYDLNTKATGVKFVGDSAIINGFQVILELNPKSSWAKKDKISDELLAHEQGHFNLGIMCMYEILEKFKKSNFTKSNYDYQLQKIVNETVEKYQRMSLKYDEETNHSKKIEQQQKWNTFFAESMTI